MSIIRNYDMISAGIKHQFLNIINLVFFGNNWESVSGHYVRVSRQFFNLKKSECFDRRHGHSNLHIRSPISLIVAWGVGSKRGGHTFAIDFGNKTP